MKVIVKYVLGVLLLVGWGNVTQAQQKKYTYFSVGAMIGTSHYQGDLDDNGFEPWRDGSMHLKTLRPSFGLQVNYHFNPHMFVRLAYNQGWINGADSLSSDNTRKARNLHFSSGINEVSAQLVYEFFASDRHYEYRPKWSPYVFTGISVFHFNPKAKPNASWVKNYPNMFAKDDYDQWVELKPLGTEGQNLPDGLRAKNDLPDPYGLTQISIPIGIGVRYMLTKKLDLRVELSMRKTFTDYLDDVGGPNYAPPEDLVRYQSEKSFLFADRSQWAGFGEGRRGYNYPYGMSSDNRKARYQGAYGQDGEFRGNRNDKDWYAFFQVGVTYILDRGARCPRFKKP